MSAISIRPEELRDHAGIRVLTEAAFRNVEHSDGSEPAIVDRLRDAGDLALSLVAEDGERIVGHIAMSPVNISDGSQRWCGLGPVSVLPSCQREGVGYRMVQRSIADMRERGARGIVVLGDPAYYSRFGFEHDPKLTYPGPSPRYFQRLVLDGDPPQGEVSYAPAFG